MYTTKSCSPENSHDDNLILWGEFIASLRSQVHEPSIYLRAQLFNVYSIFTYSLESNVSLVSYLERLEMYTVWNNYQTIGDTRRK